MRRLCQHCYLGVEEGRSHTCSASSLLAVKYLTASLPKDIKEKLSVETLRERAKETEGESVKLAQASGGHPVHVEIGKQVTVQPKEQLSCKDVLSMAASANLTGKQTDSVLADMRVCLGRSVIEPGVKSARVQHNNQYREYFSAARVNFSNSDGKLVEKPFFWCSKIQEFLKCVAEKRGRRLEDCKVKMGGDTGKGFFKLTSSLYVPHMDSDVTSKKARRNRVDGVSKRDRFSESGQRMILLLAWCKGIPETADNLERVYRAVDINSVRFIMTGDYKLLMPTFGLMSCSSTHPCLYCARLSFKGVLQDVENNRDVLKT